MRCLVRRRSVQRRLPPGVEIRRRRSDQRPGPGRGAARRRYRDSPGGRHQGSAPGDYYTGNARSHRDPGCARSRAGRSAWCTSVRWPPSDPAPTARRVDEDAEPHPLTHYGRSKLEGRADGARGWLPDAVIVRPPVVYGPRDTDVFQMLKSISQGPGAGDLRRRALVQRHLRRRPGGGPAGRRAQPQAAGRTYFLAHPKPVVLERTERRRGAHHGPHAARSADCRRGGRAAVGFCAELWARLTRQAGHHLAREGGRGAVPVLDLRYRAAPPPNWASRRARRWRPAWPQTLAWYKEAGWLSY